MSNQTDQSAKSDYEAREKARRLRFRQLRTEFPKGSIVCLLTGGREMTVTEITSDMLLLRCEWFDGEVHHVEHLDSSVLRHADGSPPQPARVVCIPEVELYAALRSIVREEMAAGR